jgi:hypothetical protein
LIENADDELARIHDRRDRKFDGDDLGKVFTIAVFDGIDHRLAHGHANPVDRIIVQASKLPDPVTDDLCEVHHVELAVDLKSDGAAAFQHAESTRPRRRQ